MQQIIGTILMFTDIFIPLRPRAWVSAERKGQDTQTETIIQVAERASAILFSQDPAIVMRTAVEGRQEIRGKKVRLGLSPGLDHHPADECGVPDAGRLIPNDPLSLAANGE
jgi:hypothetical protein